MQINLVQKEIEEALRLYLNTRGITTSSKKVEMVFTNGRKGSGLTVNVDITDTPSQAPFAAQEVSLIKLGASEAPDPQPEKELEEPEVATLGQATPAPTSSLFN